MVHTLANWVVVKRNEHVEQRNQWFPLLPTISSLLALFLNFIACNVSICNESFANSLDLELENKTWLHSLTLQLQTTVFSFIDFNYQF